MQISHPLTLIWELLHKKIKYLAVLSYFITQVKERVSAKWVFYYGYKYIKLQIHGKFFSCIWKQPGEIIVCKCFVYHHLFSFPLPSPCHGHYSLMFFLSFCVCEASLPCSKSAVFMQLPHQGTLYFHHICTKYCLICFRVGLVAWEVVYWSFWHGNGFSVSAKLLLFLCDANNIWW